MSAPRASASLLSSVEPALSTLPADSTGPLVPDEEKRPGEEKLTGEQVAAQPWFGRLLMVIACLLWSSNGLFVGASLFADWPTEKRGIVLAFWRALFAGLLLLPLVRRPRVTGSMVVLAVIFTGVNITFLSAMVRTTTANAIWLQATAPLWVYLIGLIAWRDWGQVRDRWMLALVGLGVGFIFSCEMLRTEAGSADEKYGVLLALLSGVCFGLTVLLMKRVQAEDGAWVVAFNHLIAALLMAPYMFVQDLWPTPIQLATLAAFGICQMGIPYLLFFRALKHVSPQEAAVLSLLEPLTSPLWVALVYAQYPGWWTAVGAACILAGLGIKYGTPRRRPPAVVI